MPLFGGKTLHYTHTHTIVKMWKLEKGMDYYIDIDSKTENCHTDKFQSRFHLKSHLQGVKISFIILAF
jgi:hypothetical protein